MICQDNEVFTDSSLLLYASCQGDKWTSLVSMRLCSSVSKSIFMTVLSGEVWRTYFSIETPVSSWHGIHDGNV